MLQPSDFLRILLMAAMLLLAFIGAGLYMRGFWLYFQTAIWLRRDEQAPIRRRYKSSALAAMIKEPSLANMRRQFTLSLMGLPVFAIGGICFNALQHLR